MVISELCAFLGIPAESVRGESSLLSLGLDSLKAVALSHRLRERGISVSPIDIIRADSVRGVASASSRETEQGISNEEESALEVDRLLWQDLPVESLRLGGGDQIEITAATALQAGMLSQVALIGFVQFIRYSPTLSVRRLPPQGNSTYTPLHSSLGSRARSIS